MIFGHSRLVGPRPLLTMPKALAPLSRALVQAEATSLPSIMACGVTSVSKCADCAQNLQSSLQLPNFVGRMLQNVTRLPWKWRRTLWAA